MMAARKYLDKQDSCIKKLFESINKEEVEKAIIIENNHVHTYGYEDEGAITAKGA